MNKTMADLSSTQFEFWNICNALKVIPLLPKVVLENSRSNPELRLTRLEIREGSLSFLLVYAYLIVGHDNHSFALPWRRPWSW